MYKIFTFYNPKGGVSKTTTTFNTGAFLSSNKNKKILLVDLDPQSNLTELFFSSLSDEQTLPGTSIQDAMNPMFEGSASRIDATKIELAQHIYYSNMSLLRGDFALINAETYFGNAISQAITDNFREKNIYLSLFRLLSDLIKIHSFDHVILDLWPSTGAIARMSLLCCDAFIVPITLDRFCNQSVELLNVTITGWIENHEKIMKTFEPYGLERFIGKPTFLGAVSQNFITYAGKTKRHNEIWEKNIENSIIESIIENSQIPKDNRVYSDGVYISTIKGFGSLGVVAQITGKAIFDQNRDDTTLISATGNPLSGAALDIWNKRAASYKAEIEKIAAVVL